MEHSGVLMLFFDLPNKSKSEQKKYRKFTQYIKSIGFYMLQKSVYVRLLRNADSAEMSISDIKKKSPENGNIMVLPLTDIQFSRLKNIVGDDFDKKFMCNDIVFI